VILAELGLTDDQKEMYRVARTFATQEMLPHAPEWDRTETFPTEVLRTLAEMGFAGTCRVFQWLLILLIGLYVKEPYGTGASRVDAAAIFEALSTACVSTTAYLSIHNMYEFEMFSIFLLLLLSIWCSFERQFVFPNRKH